MSSSLATLAVKYGANAGPTEVHGKGYRGSITSNAAAAVIIPVNLFVAPTPASSINKQYRNKNLHPQPPQLNNSTNTNATTRTKAKAKGGPKASQTGGNQKEPKNERRDIGADEGSTSIDPLRQEPPSKLPGGPNINNTPESQSKGGVKEQPLQRRRKQREEPPQNASANVALSGVPRYLLASENGNKRNPQQLDFRVNGSSNISPSSLRSQSLKVLKPSTEFDGFRGGVPGEPAKQQQPQPQPQPLVSTSNQVPPPSGLRVTAAKAATPARLRLPTLPAQGHSKPTPTAKTPGKVLHSDGKPVADAAPSRIHGSVQESRLSTAPLLSTSTPSRPQAPAMRSRLRPEAPVFIPAAAAPRPPRLDSALSTKTSPQGQQKQPKSPQKTNSPSGPPLSTPTPRHPSQPVSSHNTSRKSRLPPRENLSYNPFSDWRYMTDDVVLTPTIWGADPHTREGYLSPSLTRKATLRSSPHQFGSPVVDKDLHTARRSKARPGLGWVG